MSATRKIAVLGEGAPLARIVAGLAAGGLEVLDASLKEGAAVLTIKRRTWAPLASGIFVEMPLERWGAQTPEEQSVDRAVAQGLDAVGISTVDLDRGLDRSAFALMEKGPADV